MPFELSHIKSSCFIHLIETLCNLCHGFLSMYPWHHQKLLLYLKLFCCSYYNSRTKFGRRLRGDGHSILDQPCVAPLSSITISTSPSYLGLTASWAGV